MADGNILTDFGINLLEEEIDDVIFQTNEFLTDATFTGSQGPFWWLAKTRLFLVAQSLIIQSFTKFCSVRQILDGTKTGQNHRKIKSRTPCSEYPHLNICYSGAKVQICPVKNESKRIKFTSIVHFLFSCTTVDNTNRFLPRLDGLASKSRVKICFVASDSHVRRKCVGLYRHPARCFAGKRNPCSLKHRKLAETAAGRVSDRPTDNLPTDRGKSRQMKQLNIYKSIISRWRKSHFFKSNDIHLRIESTSKTIK